MDRHLIVVFSFLLVVFRCCILCDSGDVVPEAGRPKDTVVKAGSEGTTLLTCTVSDLTRVANMEWTATFLTENSERTLCNTNISDSCEDVRYAIDENSKYDLTAASEVIFEQAGSYTCRLYEAEIVPTTTINMTQADDTTSVPRTTIGDKNTASTETSDGAITFTGNPTIDGAKSTNDAETTATAKTATSTESSSTTTTTAISTTTPVAVSTTVVGRTTNAETTDIADTTTFPATTAIGEATTVFDTTVTETTTIAEATTIPATTTVAETTSIPATTTIADTSTIPTTTTIVETTTIPVAETTTVPPVVETTTDAVTTTIPASTADGQTTPVAETTTAAGTSSAAGTTDIEVTTSDTETTNDAAPSTTDHEGTTSKTVTIQDNDNEFEMFNGIHMSEQIPTTVNYTAKVYIIGETTCGNDLTIKTTDTVNISCSVKHSSNKDPTLDIVNDGGQYKAARPIFNAGKLVMAEYVRPRRSLVSSETEVSSVLQESKSLHALSVGVHTFTCKASYSDGLNYKDEGCTVTVTVENSSSHVTPGLCLPLSALLVFMWRHLV